MSITTSVHGAPGLKPPPPTRDAALTHDPAWLIQCAWSTFRLPQLQELVRGAIADVQSLSPHELLGSEPAAQGSACDPVAEALRACCDELRDASGMAGASAERAEHCSLIRGYIRQQPETWSTTFSEALDKYRQAAARAIEAALSRGSASC